MPLTRLKLTTSGAHADKRLDEVLASWMTEKFKRPVSRAKTRKLIMAGAVRVNGQRTRIPSQTLTPGSTIESSIDGARLFADATSRDRAFELTADRILFEDEDLIVVDKPAGLPAHTTADESRDNLVAAVSRFLSKRDHRPEPYIGIHQRLDRDTSGVTLFTKSRRVNAAIGEMFANHLAIKIYQALTCPWRIEGARSKAKAQWTIRNYLGKIASQGKRSRYGAVREGDLAQTSFRVIAQYPHGVWLEAIPKTGRTHQIRAHLAEYGLPILGDDLYGGDNGARRSQALASRLMLHAAKLTFPHPITRRTISAESPLPGDFEQCLRRIEAAH